MDIDRLIKKRDKYNKGKVKVNPLALENYEQHFDLIYTHQSTAMEGNTLSLIETKVLIEDKVSIGNKMLREIYEVVNHNKAYQYIKKAIAESKPLDENMIKDIHQILMDNIMQGGIYRDVDVYISGAQHTPPSPNEMYKQVKDFYADLAWKGEQLNPIELAAWTHAEFVKIHPFVDGNGRTSRLIMNYQLIQHDFLPVSIPTEDRINYYNALEEYAVNGNLAPFAKMIATLEEKQLDEHLVLVKPLNREYDR